MTRPRLPAAAVVSAALGLGVFAAPGLAQEFRARVSDLTGNPAVGSLVSLLGPDSAPRAWGIVDAQGRARLAAPPGSYAVLVQQPGRVDTVVARVAIAAGLIDSIATRVAGRRVGVPSLLEARPERCDRPGLPASLAGLWDEIVKTLRIVVLTEEQHRADLSLQAFARTLSSSLSPERESLNTLLAAANRPAGAGLPGPWTDGYLRRQADSLDWSAPDPTVFLDPGFPGAHCFGLVNGTGARLGTIGLEFAPTATGDRPTGIEGTMWVDLARRELRVIEYRFTGLPREWRPDRAGGAIEVHRMEPGFWITRFWYQRMPVVATRQGRQRLIGFRELGAEVVALLPTIDTTDRVAAAQAIAERAAETRARVARLEGVVVDTLGYPVEAAEVDVMGTEHRSTTDREGRFAIDGIPPGQQLIRARKLGYRVQYFGIRLQAGQVAEGRIGLVREPQVLGEIVVTGRYGKPARYANTAKYDDFYRRRATASGRFLTREDIDKSAAGRISELLRAIPGVRVSFATPGMAEEVSFLNCAPSSVSVWIDGQRLTGLVGEILPLIAPLDIEALEVYQRQSIIPPQFRDNACAAIVMWTR